MAIDEVYRLGFDELRQYVRQNCMKMVNELFRPELIVGIMRGGAPIMRIYSDQLDVKDLVTMSCENYSDVGVRLEEPRITQGVPREKIEGKIVLAVDDTSDSGKSLKKCVRHIRMRNPKELRTATVYIKEGSIFVPDYWVKKQDENVWVDFPGETDETIRNLFMRGYKYLLLESGFTEEEIKEVMILHYLNQPLKAMEKILLPRKVLKPQD